MSTFPYKNPISSEQLNGAQSVQRSEVFGTNFSVLSVGGYMEVFNLSDLNYTINGLGPIEYSGNSIPIDFLKGTGDPWSPDVLTLNSDNISSGRRRLGMLAYVYEADQVYQYRIDNYESLWTAATASTGTVVISDFGTTVYNTSPAGQNLINAWTASTIEDVSGYTHSTAVWKKYTISGANLSDIYLPLSGGTVSGNTYFTSGLTANTISATTYQNLPTDVYVTGGTYTNGEITFFNNTGGTFTVIGLPIGGPGGQVYYLNLSNSQPPYREFSPSGTTNSQQTTAVTISNGVTSTIASFQTPTGYPNASLIPAGYWSFYLHSFKQNNNASFDIFCEVYLRTTGGTETLLVTTDPTPVTTNSPNPSMQLTDGYYSGSSINTTDRIVVKVRATNTGNQSHSITLVTEGTQHYSYGITPFSDNTGLTCDTLSGCSTIQTIQTNISNKFDKSGGTVNGNLTVTGVTSFGNGTFTKAGSSTGDVLLDNNSTDTPGVLFYYDNNSNYGIDSWNGSYDVLSGQLLRFTNKLNESGGAVKMAIDTSGNLAVGGFIKPSAWRAGQIVQMKLFNASDLSFNSNYTNNTNTYTSVVSSTYTPLSSSSYIFFEVYAMYDVGGASADSFFSQITWNGAEVGVQRQVWANGSGGGTRSGTLFPLAGRVTNSSLTGYGWSVNVRRDSSDDGITVYNNSGFYVKITEIAR